MAVADGVLEPNSCPEPWNLALLAEKVVDQCGSQLPLIERLPVDEIDVQVLKQAGVVGQAVRYAKVIKSGELSRKVVLKGLSATAGARAAIEAAGGSLV